MSHQFPEAIARLATALGKLPGIGPRSAERLALHLVQQPESEVVALVEALQAAKSQVHDCRICGALTQLERCGICTSPNRDSSIICVVERALDVFPVEKASIFRGHYHVLGGKISPINGVEPDDLRIGELERRTSDPGVAEVIIALPMDVEGDATGYYLAQRLQRPGLLITRPAQGMASGSALEFTDQFTLGKAMEGRREITS